MDREKAVGLCLCICFGVATVWMFWDQILNHDTVWYLVATQRWIDGAELYHNILEVNPPINFYYTAPALFIADLFAIAPLNGQYILFSLLLVISLFWCWVILSDSSMLHLRSRIFFVSGLAIIIAVAPLFALVQREHVYIVFLLPWLIWQLRSVPHKEVSATIAPAVFASFGMILKPHFVMIPVFVTLWHMSSQKSWRPIFSLENWTFATVGLCYILFVWYFHRAYFDEIVPIALDIYGAVGLDRLSVLQGFDLALTGPLLAFLLVAFRTSGLAPNIGVLLFAAIGAASIYFLQNKGFDYHIIPFLLVASIAALWTIIHAQNFSISVLIASIAIICCLAVNLIRGPYQNNAATLLSRSVTDQGSLFVMTTRVSFGPIAAFMANAEWASRKPTQWYVPGIVNGLKDADCEADAEYCARLNEIGEIARQIVIQDLERFKPEVIVIDKLPLYISDPDFDWLEFMAVDPRFKAVFDQYQIEAQSRYFDYYRRAR